MKKLLMIYCCITFICAFNWGCQSIRELHYFKDKAGNPPNYYRLQIKGHAFLSSSRYLSGYFDEEAVNYYFGEISQPADASLSSKKTDDNKSIVSIDDENENRKYVLILSSNSDAIASAFGSFVESAETQKNLAMMLNQDKLLELEGLKSTAEIQSDKHKKMIALGEQFINSLSATSSNTEIEMKLLAFANAAARYFGSSETFTRPEAALAWFKSNRELLLRNNP